MVLKICTTSHRHNAPQTNAAKRARPFSVPYSGDSRITADIKLVVTTAANPVFQPMQIPTVATATNRPDGSWVNSASKALAPLTAAATARRCCDEVSSILDPL